MASMVALKQYIARMVVNGWRKLSIILAPLFLQVLEKILDWIAGDIVMSHAKDWVSKNHMFHFAILLDFVLRHPLRSTAFLALLVVIFSALWAIRTPKTTERPQPSSKEMASPELASHLTELADAKNVQMTDRGSGDERKRAYEQGKGRRTESGDCAGGPELLLTWDTPKDFASLGVDKQRLVLTNRGKIDAYKIKIQDICIDKNKAISLNFQEVNFLAAGQKQIIEPDVIGKVAYEYMKDFEMVWAQAEPLPEFCHEEPRGRHWIKFPIVIRFQEYGKSCIYESTFEYAVDRIGLHTGIVWKGCKKFTA